MKNIKKCIIKIAISILFFIVSYIIGKKYDYLYYYLVMFVCPISVMYIILQIIKILCEFDVFRKAIKLLTLNIFKGFGIVKNICCKIAEKIVKLTKASKVYGVIEYLHLKNTSRITSYTDEKIYNTGAFMETKYSVIFKRWKKCSNNAERVRFLYGKYIVKEQKKGKKLLFSDTPGEVVEKWGKTSYNTLLTDYYYKARYKKEENIEDSVIDDLLMKEKM